MMIALPIAAHYLSARWYWQTFMVETAGVPAFVFYWLFKTFELRHSDIEFEALTGRLDTDRKKLT